MRCVAVRRVAMGARAVVPLRCVVVLVTRHGCHGVRGRELIVFRVCFVWNGFLVSGWSTPQGCPAGMYGNGQTGQTSVSNACLVRRTVCRCVAVH